MSCVSNAVAVVLLFLSQGLLFAQIGEIPQSSLPSVDPKIQSIPEFAKSLVKPDGQDDPIKKLQREQLVEALQCVNSLELKFARGITGNSEFTFDQYFGYVHNACVAAFNIAETDEKKTECLEYLIETAKLVERVAEKSFNNGTASILGFKAAKFWRLDAEINLLKFKKDPSNFRFSFRSDN